MYKRTLLDYIILYFKGLAMGAANKVPGVSGGMIALIAGFYEELIYSFQKLNIKALKLLLNGRFKKFFEYINFKFLLSVNIGSISAFFSISLLIAWLVRAQSEGGLGLQSEVWSYFFGLIIGSVYYVGLKIKKWSRFVVLGVLLGSALGLYISFMDPLAPNQNYGFIFLCGIISVSGMTLPGFSGSFVLIILGNYNLLLIDAVNELSYTFAALLQGDFKMLGTASLVERAQRINMLTMIGIFTSGSVVGLVTFSKIIGYLLRKHHDVIIGWLLGFIIGSLGASWPWKTENFDFNGHLLGYRRFLPTSLDFSFWINLFMIVVGIITILFIVVYENKKNIRSDR